MIVTVRSQWPASRPASFTDRSRLQRGMSLLELLVAVFIFAVAAGALFKVIGENSRHTQQLELRFFAQLAANNALIELQLQPQWPDLGKHSQEVDLAGRRFNLTRAVEETDNDLIRKVILSASILDTNLQPLAELQAFMGPTP
ncbi:MAG: general secretion pathway protein I [Motiliproteus sp.]|jgi:general secretion pathway protein I